MEDAYRTGLSDTPLCECGQDIIESAEHFLLYCSAQIISGSSEILESAHYGTDNIFKHSFVSTS